MEELIICSPKGMPNKERFLNRELEKIIDKRRICSIKMKENGDIQILQVRDGENHKYFIKIAKKTQEDCFDIINFIEKNNNTTKFAKLIKHLEYDTFFVLFFKRY